MALMSPSPSPSLPGEKVTEDSGTERRLTLPLVAASSGSEKVDRWLHHHQDQNSQPTASQSSVSTPVAGGRGRKESIRSIEADNSPLSPISLNFQKGRPWRGSLPPKVQGITARSYRWKSIPTESMQYNCSVEVEDTFDKLLLPSTSKGKNEKKNNYDNLPIPNIDDSNSPEDLEVFGVRSDERNKQTEENLPTDKSDDKTVNENNIENPMAMDFEDDVNIVNNVSFSNLLWETQEIKMTEGPENPTGGDTNSENKTVKMDNIEEEIPVENVIVRPKVPFSLVGRMAHSVRPPRDRVIQFLQLGRLASPRTRKFSLPSLREIVEKKKLLAEVKKSEEPAEDDCKNENKETREEEEKAESRPTPGLRSPPISVPNDSNAFQLAATQCPTDKTVQQQQSPPEFDDLPPLVRMEPSCPDNTQTWLINKTMASNEENQTDFMESILGDNPDVYTQEVETAQEMKDRLARAESEEEKEKEVPAEQKRARSEDSDIEEIFSQSQRKVARIDSDHDSAGSEIPGTQQPVMERSRLKKTMVSESSSSASLLDSIDSETGEKMDTQQMEEKCRAAEMEARQLREMAGLEEQEVFQKEEESQLVAISDSDSDMFSSVSTPEKTPAVRPSQAPDLSPVPEGSDPPETQHWRFVFSNLSEDQRAQCDQLIGSLDCLGVSEKVDESVTHLVITTGEDLLAARTLKYLQAVASGVLIVSVGWVEAALLDRSQLARPEDWEVTDRELGSDGPRRSRKRREEGRPPLLSGYEVMVEGDLAHLPNLAVNDLLARVGARRVLAVNSFSFTRDITRLIIVNSAHSYGTEASRRRLRRERLAVVDKDWLLDSISSHSVRQLRDYTADGITEQDLTRAGYSSPLVGGGLTENHRN